MHSRPITYTYENDEGKEVTETQVFWFNLSQREVAELDLYGGEKDFETWYRKALKNDDRRGQYELFKEVLLNAYGVREDEGRGFRKNAELREQFASHAAYEALWDEFAEDPRVMLEFFKMVVPKKLSENWKDADVDELMNLDNEGLLKKIDEEKAKAAQSNT